MYSFAFPDNIKAAEKDVIYQVASALTLSGSSLHIEIQEPRMIKLKRNYSNVFFGTFKGGLILEGAYFSKSFPKGDLF